MVAIQIHYYALTHLIAQQSTVLMRHFLSDSVGSLPTCVFGRPAPKLVVFIIMGELKDSTFKEKP